MKAVKTNPTTVNQQIKTQAIGLALAASTAIGCVAYEKIVKTSSYFTTGLLVSLSYLPFWAASRFFQSQECESRCDAKWIVIFLASGCTGPMWYWLTKTKTVLTGAVFEVKYIAILVISSIVIGEKGVTAYTVIGSIMAMLSIYFISK